MKKIGITVELTGRLYKEIEISDEEYAFLLSEGYSTDVSIDILPGLYDECAQDIANGEYETDYAITDADGNTLIDWY